MVLRVSDADRMTITGIGSVGISESSPDMKLELRESGVTISAAGNAISGSTMKGIHLANSNNDDTSLGIWATTGDAHWSVLVSKEMILQILGERILDSIPTKMVLTI